MLLPRRADLKTLPLKTVGDGAEHVIESVGRPNESGAPGNTFGGSKNLLGHGGLWLAENAQNGRWLAKRDDVNVIPGISC